MMMNPLLVETKHLIDSLPYIDEEYNDSAMQKRVETLIQQEMRSFQPRNYLSHLPEYTPTFSNDSMLQSEFKRVSNGVEMPQLDTNRYTLQGAAEQDVKAWEKAIANAETQLEHESTRLLNLELLQQFGSDVWKSQVAILASQVQTYEDNVKELKEKAQKVNMERKRDQMINCDKFATLTHKRNNLIRKNRDIEVRKPSVYIESTCAHRCTRMHVHCLKSHENKKTPSVAICFYIPDDSFFSHAMMQPDGSIFIFYMYRRAAQSLAQRVSAQYLVGVAGATMIGTAAAHTESFAETYDLHQRLLGQGTFGRVQRCFDRENGTASAVKVISTQDAAVNQSEVKQETQILDGIQLNGGHPNIVSYSASFYEDRFIYIVTEYLKGDTLYSHLLRNRDLSETQAKMYMKQLTSAVAFCHDRDIVHGDIKPDNMMIHLDRLTLVDFGSARYTHQLEQLKSMSGTQAYWSPEMIESMECSTAMDTWALGCIMYIMISGAHPFDLQGTGDMESIMTRICTHPVEFSSPVWGQVSEETKDLILDMLQKDPTKRPKAVEIQKRVS